MMLSGRREIAFGMSIILIIGKNNRMRCYNAHSGYFIIGSGSDNGFTAGKSEDKGKFYKKRRR